MKQLLLAVALMMSAAGCGGGGGGQSANPANEVSSQVQALASAWEAEDVDRILSFYSNSYTDSDGETKESISNDLPTLLSIIEVLDTEVTTGEYIVSNSGSTVTVAGGYSVTATNEVTGEPVSFGTNSTDTWKKEPQGWRLQSSTELPS